MHAHTLVFIKKKKVPFKLPDVNGNEGDVTVLRNIHLYKVPSHFV